MVRHQLPKLTLAGSSPVARSMSTSAKVMHLGFFIFGNVAGLEPMRWNSVKKTAQWAVFRNSPEGFSLRDRGARSAAMSPVARSRNLTAEANAPAVFVFEHGAGH